MSFSAENLTGKKFGKLLVLGRSVLKFSNPKWWCLCECGNFKLKASGHLKGRTPSCGCERYLKRSIQWKKEKTTHGLSFSKVHRTWDSMRQRCNNENHHSFNRYGGRGIKVCREWDSSLENFVKDMGHPPLGKSLDRIDNEKGYYKENCRWASKIEQGRNRSNNTLVTLGGITKCQADWDDIFGLSKYRMSKLINQGKIWDGFKPNAKQIKRDAEKIIRIGNSN